MRMMLDIPDVQACDVTSCGYNAEERCHARAITVGEGIHASCDTFFESDRHVKNTASTAGVGACKIAGCRHNSDLECAAEAIQIGMHGSHADCLTYAPR